MKRARRRKPYQAWHWDQNNGNGLTYLRLQRPPGPPVPLRWPIFHVAPTSVDYILYVFRHPREGLLRLEVANALGHFWGQLPVACACDWLSVLPGLPAPARRVLKHPPRR